MLPSPQISKGKFTALLLSIRTSRQQTQRRMG
jgi:hypothetical protein